MERKGSKKIFSYFRIKWKIKGNKFPNIATENEQKLAEAVRKYPVLYDKQDKYFKDKNKKRLARQDVAKEVKLENGNKILQIIKFRSIQIMVTSW